MIEIAPSILSSNFGKFAEEVASLETAGADWLHFDVMDGQFVPPITFGAQLVADLKATSNLKFEAHLMTQTPERHFEAFARAGCQRIIFHIEATVHAHRLCQELRSTGIEAGIALNPGTPASLVHPLLEVADLFLVMTVNPGWGGQKFIPETLTKISTLRSWSDLPIEVDGGIDAESIREVYDAGARVFVAGSYLAKAPDQAEAIRKLRAACAD